MPRTGVLGENSPPSTGMSAWLSTAPADQAASASIARYSRNSRFAGVANTNITALYDRNPTALSHASTAAAKPRAASSIETPSTGTPASRTTSAVPLAEPFITAVPRSTEGSRNVSSAAAVAAAASAADNQYAGPRGPSTPAGPRSRGGSGNASGAAAVAAAASAADNQYAGPRGPITRIWAPRDAGRAACGCPVAFLTLPPPGHGILPLFFW